MLFVLRWVYKFPICSTNPGMNYKETKRIVYSYKDEHGHELYRKIRIEPGSNGKAKDFFCERY